MSNLKYNLDTLQNKARERTVRTQNVEYDLESIVKRIKNKQIKLDPEYQRRHRWDNDTASRLIESILLNIPIPVIFISQDIDADTESDDDAARFTIIDGQQRLTAIFDFMNNNLKMSGLNIMSELNGCSLSDLPPFLSRRLDERTIKCLRIDSTLDPDVKYDIFERLNTGSIKLEPQELRNAIARGSFNDMLKISSQLPEFREMLRIIGTEDEIHRNAKVMKMEDVELTLRFFALKDSGYTSLKKGFKDFLTEQLVKLNALPVEEIQKKSQEFSIYMKFIHNKIGTMPFAKLRMKDGKIIRIMSTFNAAVFDAVAVGIADTFTADEILGNPDTAASRISGYQKLFEDPQFFEDVSGSVNDQSKVISRITKMMDFIKK